MCLSERINFQFGFYGTKVTVFQEGLIGPLWDLLKFNKNDESS